MARLPSECYLVQGIGGRVIVFADGSEREIASCALDDDAGAEAAFAVIRESELSDEDRCFACFWVGYFAGSLAAPVPPAGCPVSLDRVRGLVGVFADEGHWVPVVEFDPHDQNAAARAQKNVYDCDLSPEQKSRAHFWCGVYYAQAG